MGETGDSRRNLGLGGSAKNAPGPVNLAVILKQYPRFEIRADNGQFLEFLSSTQLGESSLLTVTPGCARVSVLLRKRVCLLDDYVVDVEVSLHK